MKFFYHDEDNEKLEDVQQFTSENILDGLKEGSIFCVELIDNKKALDLIEQCDKYFIARLSKEEVKRFINELTDIYNQMKD